MTTRPGKPNQPQPPTGPRGVYLDGGYGVGKTHLLASLWHATPAAPEEKAFGTFVELTNLVGAPFVLHLWDVLQGDVSSGALRELVDRAESVFCVSQPLLNDVSLIRSDAELLYFSRDASLSTAAPRERGALKIVMHGNIHSYVEGLDDLDEAITKAKKAGAKVQLPPTPVDGYHFAIIEDPEGNPIGLITPFEN